MKKIFIVSFLVILFAVPCFSARPCMKIGLCSVDLIDPSLSDFDNTTEGGVGIYIQQLFGTKSLKFGWELSYLPIYKYDHRTDVAIPSSDPLIPWDTLTTIYEVKSSVIPVLAVIDYKLGSKKKLNPYLQAGAGLSICSSSIKTSESTSSTSTTTKESETDAYFTLMVGAGVLIKLTDKLNIDTAMKYYTIKSEGDSTAFLGLCLGIQL